MLLFQSLTMLRKTRDKLNGLNPLAAALKPMELRILRFQISALVYENSSSDSVMIFVLYLCESSKFRATDKLKFSMSRVASLTSSYMKSRLVDTFRDTVRFTFCNEYSIQLGSSGSMVKVASAPVAPYLCTSAYSILVLNNPNTLNTLMWSSVMSWSKELIVTGRK